MCRQILILFCALLVAIMQTGCIGFGLLEPRECHIISPPTSNPASDIYIFWKKPKIPSTKEDFLRDWGKPDKITIISETLETWVYERNLWCGYIPAAVVMVPLVLPVCDGFDELTFTGDVATYLYTKRSRMSGCYLPGGCFIDPCWPSW